MISVPVGQVGLNDKEWKQAKVKMLETGEFDPNTSAKLSEEQRYWVKETHKSIRNLKEKYEPETE